MPRPHETQEPTEKLFLVYVNSDDSEDDLVEGELRGLTEAAGAEVAGEIRQRLDRPYKGTYIGSGKVIEVQSAATETDADTIVVDTELSGIQIRNLEEQTGKRVIDRPTLILDIFARRAHTREGQLQVELAQLSYRLPRLMSVYTKFERQRGGIGMRGPGETQLESDRRMINTRIAKLKEEIDDVRRHRALQRKTRSAHPVPTVSLVGYTSAGKSTLMNRLCGTDLLADAMPFATLDPTTRRVEAEDGTSFFLTDTVGFIRNLPTTLVAAFRATLEEVSHADLLLHVVDVSHHEWEAQRDAVIETLEEIGADGVPMLTVFNKIDATEDPAQARELVAQWPGSVAVSALKGTGMTALIERVRQRLSDRWTRVKALVPYDKSGLVESCRKTGRLISEEFQEGGVLIEADVVPEYREKLAAYTID